MAGRRLVCVLRVPEIAGSVVLRVYGPVVRAGARDQQAAGIERVGRDESAGIGQLRPAANHIVGHLSGRRFRSAISGDGLDDVPENVGVAPDLFSQLVGELQDRALAGGIDVIARQRPDGRRAAQVFRNDFSDAIRRIGTILGLRVGRGRRAMIRRIVIRRVGREARIVSRRGARIRLPFPPRAARRVVLRGRYVVVRAVLHDGLQRCPKAIDEPCTGDELHCGSLLQKCRIDHRVRARGLERPTVCARGRVHIAVGFDNAYGVVLHLPEAPECVVGEIAERAAGILQRRDLLVAVIADVGDEIDASRSIVHHGDSCRECAIAVSAVLIVGDLAAAIGGLQELAYGVVTVIRFLREEVAVYGERPSRDPRQGQCYGNAERSCVVRVRSRGSQRECTGSRGARAVRHGDIRRDACVNG